MAEEFEGEVVTSVVPHGVGAQLRTAREKLGLSTAQVAAQTRIGVRNIENMEEGLFQNLPGRIYAIGFSKTYAKLVGLDPNDVADQVRIELGDDPELRGQSADFAPGDPSRGPSRKLVWVSVLAALVLMVGLYFAARVLMDPAAQLPSLTEQQEAEQAAANAATAAQQAENAQPVEAGGAVVLTAEAAVWLRLTDAAGQRLMEGELAAGQTYTIPADAEGPKLLTGRPDMLAITVGGRAVPKISETNRTVVDVPIDGASLLARAAPTASATPAPSASFTPAATPRPASTGD